MGRKGNLGESGCTAKDALHRAKRQYTLREKGMFADHTPDQVFMSKMSVGWEPRPHP